jgi:16S rRNA processing protein RimM
VVGVRTDEPDARFALGTRLDTDPEAVGPLTVSAVRWQSGELIVRFRGIRDRTAAAGLRGAWLTVEAETLGALDDPDEFRDHELTGLTARRAGGETIGTVADVLHHGQDLLAITPASGTGPEILVPFVKAIVTRVDIAGGYLEIDPPPGLLETGEAELAQGTPQCG